MEKHLHSHDHNQHGHNHNHDYSELSGKKILFATLLNGIITIVEIIGGLLSGSLALLSDSLHNLSDTIAIALSYFTNKISKKSGNERKTFGYKRAEILSAFINSASLLAISILLIIEAIKRFYNPETINGNMMLIVATVGLLANLIAVILLQKDSKGNINIKSSYLHLISDTVSSVGVILGGIAIKLWNITWIDPVITIAISIYIIKESYEILVKTINILMQSSPQLDFEDIKDDIEKIEGVNNIHHIHAWYLNDKALYFEAHVDVIDMKVSQTNEVYKEICEILNHEHGVNHITIQFEHNLCEDKKIIKDEA